MIDVDEGDDSGDDGSFHPGGVNQGGGGLSVADASSEEEQAFKPTNNIVGSEAPGIGPGPGKPCPPGTGKADNNSDFEVDPFKPTNNIVGAPPPNLMDGYTNDAEHE